MILILLIHFLALIGAFETGAFDKKLILKLNIAADMPDSVK